MYKMFNIYLSICLAQYFNFLEKHNHELYFYNTLIVDESKRLGKPKTSEDLFGIDGSFKKLDLD